MTYFSLRKPDPEPSQEEPGEEGLDEEPDTPEEAGDKPDEEKPEPDRGPILSGIFGPGQWITARFNRDTAIIAHGAAGFSVIYYGGWIAASVITGWLFFVALFIPRDALERWAEAVERHHPGRPRKPPADEAPDTGNRESADPRTALIGWLDDLTRGRSGIHLDELHQALTAHPQLADLKRAEMRAWLDRHGVAVERTLRVGRIAGRSGVSRSTVEALLKTLPPLVESGGLEPLVHASDLRDSPVESGVERGGEHAV